MKDNGYEEYFQDKRILVTGGAGFVGTNLVMALAKLQPRRVTVLDNLFTGKRENLAGLDVEFINGDVNDFELVSELVKRSDMVFHLAARNIIVSTTDPQSDFATNTRGTFNVLEAARGSDVERVVYTSSVSIFGNAVHLPIDEEDQVYPLNPYGASKLCGESYCHAYYETYNVPVTIVRYSNVYGPYQFPANPYCGVISKFIEWASMGKPLQIHGDGEQTRDFTYVEDAVEATIRAAVKPQALGGTFNVGTAIEVSINQLAKTVLEVVDGGRTSSLQYVQKRDIDNVRRRVLSIERSRRVLRWSPSYTLREGLRKTWEWARASLFEEPG